MTKPDPENESDPSAQSSQEVFLFIDTNLLMEYIPIKDIDWPRYLNALHVRLLIVPLITKELDIHKTGDNRKRNRAIAAIRMLDELPESLEPVKIRRGVSLQFLAINYTDYSSHGLTDRGDDQILLHALHFLDEHQGTDVRIVTGDKIFRLRMKSYGIRAVRIPDDWLLPPQEDAMSKKVRELENKAATLPRLELSFENGGNHTQITLPYPLSLDWSQLRRRVVEKSPLNAIAYSPFYADASRDYNKRLVINYIDEDYKSFSEDWLEFHQAQARSCTISLKFANSGGGPARNVRLELKIHCDVELKINGDRELEPTMPETPQLDLTNRFTGENYNDSPTPVVAQSKRAAFSDASLELVGSTVIVKIVSLQHHQSLTLPRFSIEFDDRRYAKSFSISARIVCDELLQPSEQTLHVEVTKSPNNSKHFEVPLPY